MSERNFAVTNRGGKIAFTVRYPGRDKLRFTQSFRVEWYPEPTESKAVNARRRAWYARMLREALAGLRGPDAPWKRKRKPKGE